MINLRPYQQVLYDKIINKLEVDSVEKLCAVLPTGGGKSVVIAKLAEELPGRTLILTHRIEILTQNSDWLKKAGVLSAKKNTIMLDNKVVIAMVQTAYARIKKYGTEYLGNFDNIILDEVQVLIFKKVFEQYNFKRLVGFTATPVLEKKKYYTVDEIEYVEPYTLSEIFDDIVQGVDTQDLIDLGYLTQDNNFVLDLPEFDKLVSSETQPDGYTVDSLNQLYSNKASLDILLKAYNQHAKNKKTLIFNASTKINKIVYDKFKAIGLNVKMFDSVNESELSREEVIKWFESERDAILINTSVFTTGFNVTDVEVVIVNRATKSLSLWVQMVGRGSRVTDKIFKQYFTVIDLGQNIYKHGIWSMKRDWSKMFFPHGRKRKRKSDMLDTWICKPCGAMNLTGETHCSYCGAEKDDVVVKKGNKRGKTGIIRQVGETPIPRGKAIVKYCTSNNLDANFAFRLTERKIIELFISYKVSGEFYLKNRKKFAERVLEIYRPIYFAILNSELKGSRKRLITQVNKLINKINKMYE